MILTIPVDSEIHRLAGDDIQACSFCKEYAHIVAREYDINDRNVGNIYFCWDHWGDYLAQENPGYFVKRPG